MRATVFRVIQIDLQGLLGTIIDGQSSSRMTSATDWKGNKGDGESNTENKRLDTEWRAFSIQLTDLSCRVGCGYLCKTLCALLPFKKYHKLT